MTSRYSSWLAIGLLILATTTRGELLDLSNRQNLVNYPLQSPATPRFKDDNNRQYRPQIATNGTGFLVAWYEQYYGTDTGYWADVYVARIDEQGNVLDPDGIFIDAALNYNPEMYPTVCATGEDYWVFFSRDWPFERMYGSKVTANSGTVTTPTLVGQAGDYATLSSFDCAYNGQNILLAWRKTSVGVCGSLISPDGTVLMNSVVLSAASQAERVDVSASGSRFLLSYYDDGWPVYGLRAMRVGSDGSVLDTVPAEVSNEGYSRLFGVAPESDHWKLFYQKSDGSGGRSIGAFQVNDGGTSQTLAMDLAIDHPQYGPWGVSDLARISAIPSSSGYLVGWSVADSVDPERWFGMVFDLMPDFQERPRHELPPPDYGYYLSLARNTIGRTVAIWNNGTGRDTDDGGYDLEWITYSISPTPGDANGDRVVTLVELNAAVVAFRGLAPVPSSADADGNGILTTSELNAVVIAYRQGIQ
ncbi:hypothetical protein KQI84_18005 [bacterium]|nr:hypothetical protein [bacterium]